MSAHRAGSAGFVVVASAITLLFAHPGPGLPGPLDDPFATVRVERARDGGSPQRFSVRVALREEAVVQVLGVGGDGIPQLLSPATADTAAAVRTADGEIELGPWPVRSSGRRSPLTHVLVIASEGPLSGPRLLAALGARGVDPEGEPIPAFVRWCRHIRGDTGWAVRWLPIPDPDGPGST